MDTTPEPALVALLQAHGIARYEVTDAHYGNSLAHGPLRKLIIWDRFVPDPSAFAALGFGLVFRESSARIDTV